MQPAATEQTGLWRLRLEIDDSQIAAEQIAAVLQSLAARLINADTLATDDDGSRTIDLLISGATTLTSDDLASAMTPVARKIYLRPARAADARDTAIRVLDGVTAILNDPASVPKQIADLIEADSFELVGALDGTDDQTDVLRLQWTPNHHIVLRRDWAPFSRAEQSRASAAMRLAEAMARLDPPDPAHSWVEELPGGSMVWIRLARPEDADAVAAMLDRCSERTISSRYFRNVTSWRDLTLRRMAGGHPGASIVVMAENGHIVGLGNVFPIDTALPGRTAEIAMLVDDEHQGLGIGRRLLSHLIDIARRLDFDNVVASVLADNRVMLGLLDQCGVQWTRRVESGVTEFEASLPQRR